MSWSREPNELRPDQHEEKQDRERHHDLAQPRDAGVHDPSQHSRQRTQGDAEQEGDHRGEETDLIETCPP